MWGVMPTPPSLIFGRWEKNKYSYYNFIIGTMCGIITSELRYDEEYPLKEDYDFTCQNIKAFGGSLRCNEIRLEAAHVTNKGGCQEFRTLELDKEMCVKLLEKWPNYIRKHVRREGQVMLHVKNINKLSINSRQT